MTKYRFAMKCLVLFGFGLLLGTGTGCGGPSADQACTDMAKASCAKRDECEMNGTELLYGNLGNCITRLKAQCLAGLMAPSAGNDTGHVESCSQALPNETCQDFLQNNPVADCVPKSGGLSNNSPCAFNTQCQSLFCSLSKTSNCGTCQNPTKAGDPCIDNGCSYNQSCTPMGVCEPYVAAGGTCDNKLMVCSPGMACVIASGQTMGSCKVKGAAVGAACDNKVQTMANCDSNKGLVCDGNTSKCIQETYANDGEDCGSSNGGASFATCIAGSCVDPGSGGQAACVASADVGGSCDTVMGPNCLAPARCVVGAGTTSGMCMTLDGTMCMSM